MPFTTSSIIIITLAILPGFIAHLMYKQVGRNQITPNRYTWLAFFGYSILSIFVLFILLAIIPKSILSIFPQRLIQDSSNPLFWDIGFFLFGAEKFDLQALSAHLGITAAGGIVLLSMLFFCLLIIASILGVLFGIQADRKLFSSWIAQLTRIAPGAASGLEMLFGHRTRTAEIIVRLKTPAPIDTSGTDINGDLYIVAYGGVLGAGSWARMDEQEPRDLYLSSIDTVFLSDGRTLSDKTILPQALWLDIADVLCIEAFKMKEFNESDEIDEPAKNKYFAIHVNIAIFILSIIILYYYLYYTCCSL